MVIVDGAANFLFGGEVGVRGARAHHAEGEVHDRLNDDHNPRSRGDQPGDRLADGHRHTIGPRDGIGLRQDLGKDEDEYGHHRRRDGNAGRARQERGEKRRCQRRGEDIDEIVAKQDRADQPLAVRNKRIHSGRALVSLTLQLVHACARGGGEGCFRA